MRLGDDARLSIHEVSQQMWASLRSHVQAGAKQLRQQKQQIEDRLLGIPTVQLVVRTVRELGADDASHMAAGVAFYGVLALFPLLLGLIALFGMFLPSQTVQEQLFDFFGRNLPGSVELVEQNINHVIRLRGALGLLSLVGLFWSGSAMFGAVSRAINRAWDIHEDRPFYKRKLRDLSMALGIGVLFLLSLGVSSVVSFLSSAGLPYSSAAVDIGARFVAFFITLAIFLLIYRFIPNTKVFWRYIWTGAILGAVLFEIAKTLFVLYIDRFTNYEAVYGSVASVIILLLWIYISAFIIILGAEFSSEYGRMREGVGRGIPIASALSERQQNPSCDQPKRSLKRRR